ncbi:hypothetical protein AX16_011021 [Volvariella volvacea WC 439]|nr:hypothetical protein AX16_011021 [Volvariella volvacea WC 439]
MLSLFHGPVLGASYATLIIAESFLIEAQIIDVFGLRTIGEERALGRIDRGWRSLLFILDLPLNFIPGIGTQLFLCLQGYHLRPLHHYQYTQLLGYDNAMHKAHIQHNCLQYSLFGLAHVTLQMIPVLNIFFLFATGAGAALWASKTVIRQWEEGRGYLKVDPTSPLGPGYAVPGPGFAPLAYNYGTYVPPVPPVGPSPHGVEYVQQVQAQQRYQTWNGVC